jgi:hypothetical protein
MTAPLPDTYAFEATLHARPAMAEPIAAGPPLQDQWGTWPTLALRPDQFAEPLPILSDEALSRLASLPRLYAEPDGAFVWTSPREGLRWQVDGTLFERDDRVLLVDLKGSCPPAEFDQLLACFGAPPAAVVFQLVRSAVTVDEATLRNHALARGRAGDGETLRPPDSCGW